VGVKLKNGNNTLKKKKIWIRFVKLIENRKIGIYLKENINNSINKSIFHNSKLKKKNPRIQIIALIMFFIK